MQRLIAKVPSLFFLQFPVLTHVGILIGNRSLSFLAFLLLTLGFCIQLIRVNRLYQIAAMVAASSVLSYLYLRGMTDWLVYVPPIFIPLFLTFFFGATLRRGRESIVTSIGERARGPLDDDAEVFLSRQRQQIMTRPLVEDVETGLNGIKPTTLNGRERRVIVATVTQVPHLPLLLG